MSANALQPTTIDVIPDVVLGNPTTTATHHPWSRQPDEPSLWYDRFLTYFLSPGSTRSILNAYRRYRVATETCEDMRKILSTCPSWDTYARTYNWRQRALAYDDHQRDLFMQQQEQLAIEVRQERIEANRLLLRKATQGLNAKTEEDLHKESVGALSSATKVSSNQLRLDLDGADRKHIKIDIMVRGLPPILQQIVVNAISAGK